MRSALLLCLLLHASTLAASHAIEVLGKGKLPASAVSEIRKAALTAGIEMVAIEKIDGQYFPMIFLYGPMARTANGACRGALYVVDAQDGEGGTASWQILPLDKSTLVASYAVDNDRCPGPLSSRVRIMGTLSDTDLASILEAIHKGNVAYDPSGRPHDVKIGKNLTIDTIRIPGDIEGAGEDVGSATVLMADRITEETLNVALVRIAGHWLISHAE